MPNTTTRYSADPIRSGEQRHRGLRRLPDTTRHLLISFLGELVGTFLFLFFAFAGTQVANNLRTISGSPHMDLASLLYISLAFAFSLAVNVWVFVRISGGLFNPAARITILL
jgi:aquaporin related protein